MKESLSSCCNHPVYKFGSSSKKFICSKCNNITLDKKLVSNCLRCKTKLSDYHIHHKYCNKCHDDNLEKLRLMLYERSLENNSTANTAIVEKRYEFRRGKR